MHKFGKHSMAILLAAALVLVPLATAALGQDTVRQEEYSAGEMGFDALVVRPFGVLATALGASIFVVSLPFSALGGNTKEAFDKLVAEPAHYTFKRRLGDF